ncbi:hypothetical protein BLA29_014428 [Euroglyphus maynei]|uniref:Uncharacterized protein n=1 Tax=Euroglyphus maynei TaxID=6958 RepID=A0A1Y3BU27_EURMA|nr:hypothetical protein BLA29_014428 [Euroglyphus maynei]
MKTAGCFNETLASITWDRINKFMPNLYCDLIEPQMKRSQKPMEEDVKESKPQEMHHIETVRK